MNSHHPLQQKAAEETCSICGRGSAESIEPLSHLPHAGKTIAICSPQCMEAFQRDPDRFAAHERRRAMEQTSL